MLFLNLFSKHLLYNLVPFFQGCQLLKKTNVYENCPVSNTMQDNPVRTLRITFKYVISSPVPVSFFHTFLPLSTFIQLWCLYYIWVGKNLWRTSWKQSRKYKHFWSNKYKMVLQACPAEHIPSRIPLGF